MRSLWAETIVLWRWIRDEPRNVSTFCHSVIANEKKTLWTTQKSTHIHTYTRNCILRNGPFHRCYHCQFIKKVITIIFINLKHRKKTISYSHAEGLQNVERSLVFRVGETKQIVRFRQRIGKWLLKRKYRHSENRLKMCWCSQSILQTIKWTRIAVSQLHFVFASLLATTRRPTTRMRMRMRMQIQFYVYARAWTNLWPNKKQQELAHFNAPREQPFNQMDGKKSTENGFFEPNCSTYLYMLNKKAI